jgi:molybdopterin molybdotransferase
MKKMISIDEAYEIVMTSAFSTGTEQTGLADAHDRVLAEDVTSDIDFPPFYKSNVDGYACRKADIKEELELTGVIPAGEVPAGSISPGQCMKIMTGAMIPEGADHVFMVEDSMELPSGRIVCTRIDAKDNISRKGEDVHAGDIILRAGRIIQPADLAVLASAGYSSVKVSRKPVVAIISSGSELVEPEVKPLRSQIRNSNAYQLIGQIRRAGGEDRYYGIAPDDEEKTYEILTMAISSSDIVLLTGGVSMGDFDFIPGVMERAGIKIHFSKIAVQPGKPTVFGTMPKCLVFGLPGNPVSSFIQFELLVRPLIAAMTGSAWKPLELVFTLGEEFTRKSADRLAFVPVNISGESYVTPVTYRGSAHIAALSYAWGIMAVPEGIKVLRKGEKVRVRQI